MDERAIAEHASDDLSDEAFNERELTKDYSPWRITPQGVTGCIPYKHLRSRISGVSFRQETSVKILEMLERLYKDGRIKGKSLYDEEDVEEE